MPVTRNKIFIEETYIKYYQLYLYLKNRSIIKTLEWDRAKIPVRDRLPRRRVGGSWTILGISIQPVTEISRWQFSNISSYHFWSEHCSRITKGRVHLMFLYYSPSPSLLCTIFIDTSIESINSVDPTHPLSVLVLQSKIKWTVP